MRLPSYLFAATAAAREFVESGNTDEPEHDLSSFAQTGEAVAEPPATQAPAPAAPRHYTRTGSAHKYGYAIPKDAGIGTNYNAKHGPKVNFPHGMEHWEKKASNMLWRTDLLEPSGPGGVVVPKYAENYHLTFKDPLVMRNPKDDELPRTEDQTYRAQVDMPTLGEPKETQLYRDQKKLAWRDCAFHLYGIPAVQDNQQRRPVVCYPVGWQWARGVELYEDTNLGLPGLMEVVDAMEKLYYEGARFALAIRQGKGNSPEQLLEPISEFTGAVPQKVLYCNPDELSYFDSHGRCVFRDDQGKYLIGYRNPGYLQMQNWRGVVTHSAEGNSDKQKIVGAAGITSDKTYALAFPSRSEELGTPALYKVPWGGWVAVAQETLGGLAEEGVDYNEDSDPYQEFDEEFREYWSWAPSRTSSALLPEAPLGFHYHYEHMASGLPLADLESRFEYDGIRDFDDHAKFAQEEAERLNLSAEWDRLVHAMYKHVHGQRVVEATTTDQDNSQFAKVCKYLGEHNLGIDRIFQVAHTDSSQVVLQLHYRASILLQYLTKVTKNDLFASFHQCSMQNRRSRIDEGKDPLALYVDLRATALRARERDVFNNMAYKTYTELHRELVTEVQMYGVASPRAVQLRDVLEKLADDWERSPHGCYFRLPATSSAPGGVDLLINPWGSQPRNTDGRLSRHCYSEDTEALLHVDRLAWITTAAGKGFQPEEETGGRRVPAKDIPAATTALPTKNPLDTRLFLTSNTHGKMEELLHQVDGSLTYEGTQDENMPDAIVHAGDFSFLDSQVQQTYSSQAGSFVSSGEVYTTVPRVEQLEMEAYKTSRRARERVHAQGGRDDSFDRFVEQEKEAQERALQVKLALRQSARGTAITGEADLFPSAYTNLEWTDIGSDSTAFMPMPVSDVPGDYLSPDLEENLRAFSKLGRRWGRFWKVERLFVQGGHDVSLEDYAVAEAVNQKRHGKNGLTYEPGTMYLRGGELDMVRLQTLALNNQWTDEDRAFLWMKCIESLTPESERHIFNLEAEETANTCSVEELVHMRSKPCGHWLNMHAKPWHKIKRTQLTVGGSGAGTWKPAFYSMTHRKTGNIQAYHTLEAKLRACHLRSYETETADVQGVDLFVSHDDLITDGAEGAMERASMLFENPYAMYDYHPETGVTPSNKPSVVFMGNRQAGPLVRLQPSSSSGSGEFMFFIKAPAVGKGLHVYSPPLIVDMPPRAEMQELLGRHHAPSPVVDGPKVGR
ncbi:unnamed protein product [Amoebophrya sp. A120]|nr:unnamed protein product [Amoebophrya sp. A120]|eukprot:GSA120T00016594001.1